MNKQFTMAAIVAVLMSFVYPMTSWAQKVTIDGVKYDFYFEDGNNYSYAYVSACDKGKQGDLVIPSSVNYNGKEYLVKRISSNAFADCTGLTSIDIPSSVTNISFHAFKGCTGLTSISMPVVEGIDIEHSDRTYPFSGCDNVTSLIIKEGSTYASSLGLTGLTSVVISEGVTYIDVYAFYGCTGLTSIDIPKSVKEIGSYAFKGCTGLTSVDIPSSVTGIYQEAFSGCTGLTSVTLPLYRIDDYWSREEISVASGAFSGCDNVTTLTIQEGSTYASSLGLTGLTSVTIPSSVTEIGSFEDCAGLTSIDIPSSVTSIVREAFFGCSGLTSIAMPSHSSIVDNRDYYNSVLFDTCSHVTSLRFKEGSTYASSYGCTSLTSVMIPEGVTEIGSFSGCTGLTSIDIPSSVTSIGYAVFKGCTGLTSVNIPISVKEIGRGAFSGCTGLTSVTIPGDWNIDQTWEVIEIFDGCDNLTTLIIQEGSTRASSYWFSGWTSVVIPESVTEIGNFYCPGLTSIEFPKGVKKIGSFYGCTGLTSIEFPEGVTEIDCFGGCTGLTSIVIPEGVTKIWSEAFEDCTGLTSVVLPSTLSEITGSAFGNCSNLTSVTIPEGVKVIGGCAFYGCTRLAELNIPSSVTEIEYSAFERCNQLTSLTLSENFEKLGEQVFAGCSRLKTLYSKSAEPPYAEWNSFEGMAPKVVVYVPVGAKAAYEDAAGWQNLTIEEFDFTDEASPSIALPFTAYATSDGVVLSATEGETEVAVYSLQGVELYRGTVSGGETVVALPSGSYVVRAGNGQGTLVIVP